MIKTNVMRILEDNNISYVPHFYEVKDELDAVSVAKKLNMPIEKVFKTLVLQSNKEYFVCVINGGDEIDLKKAARCFNVKSISMLNLANLTSVTGGYVRGGTSPIGMKKLYKTIIDEKAFLQETIIYSAGKRGVQVETSPNDLLKITGAIKDDIRK